MIYISGYGHDGSVAVAIETGAVGCFFTSFSPSELVALVRTALRRVWNLRNGANANLVHIVVMIVRRKFGEDAANPEWTFDMHRVGYRMAEPAEEKSWPRPVAAWTCLRSAGEPCGCAWRNSVCRSEGR